MVICQGNDWKIKKLNLSIKNKTDFIFIKEKKLSKPTWPQEKVNTP